MNCQLCQKELDAYQEGRLSPDMRAQVEDHLKGCEACAKVWKLLIFAERIIDQEKGLQGNPFLSTRIMARIENLETQGHKTIPVFMRLLKPALIMTLLAAAIFLGVIMGNIYKPVVKGKEIPFELALIDDATMEMIDMLSNE